MGLFIHRARDPRVRWRSYTPGKASVQACKRHRASVILQRANGRGYLANRQGFVIFPTCRSRGCAIYRSLSNIGLFQSFDAAERKRVEALCAWKSFRPGETVSPAQDRSREVYFLTSGTARAYIASAAGVVVAFGDIPAGTMFGEIAAIDGEPRPVEVEAVTVCTVARMAHADFLRLIEERPGFAMAVLRQISLNIRRLTARIFEFSTLPVKSRVHAELLRLAAHAQKSNQDKAAKGGGVAGTIVLSPAPKHAAIAARISTHREAVTRELNALVKKGVLKKVGADLVLCDVVTLKALLEDAIVGRQY